MEYGDEKCDEDQLWNFLDHVGDEVFLVIPEMSGVYEKYTCINRLDARTAGGMV